MRILLVSEAFNERMIGNPWMRQYRRRWNWWKRFIPRTSPIAQTSGVVVMLYNICRELTALGHEYCIMHPGMFPNIELPWYKEIRMTLNDLGLTKNVLRDFNPERVHIFTEGPLGLIARHHLQRLGMRFTTSFHTKFPEYFNEYWGIPPWVSYPYFRWFHGTAVRTMVSTETMVDELTAKGFERLVIWPRGVDTTLFSPGPAEGLSPLLIGKPRPWYLSVGRISVEKNIEAFLRAKPTRPGTKIVIGDGPLLKDLQRQYPDAVYLGKRSQIEIVQYHRASDVFLMSSRSETLGLVVPEALACGTPVAAYPVTGPNHFIHNGVNGWMDTDLAHAMDQCLLIDRIVCRKSIEHFTWQNSARSFLSHLVPAQ